MIHREKHQSRKPQAAAESTVTHYQGYPGWVRWVAFSAFGFVFVVGLLGILLISPVSDQPVSCPTAANQMASIQPPVAHRAASQPSNDTLSVWQRIASRWTPESAGQLGDFVGGITNPILAFLTLTALIYTINLQRRQLDLAAEQLEFMREELVLSREELALSREALRDSADQLTRSAEAQEQTLEAQRRAADAQQHSAQLMQRDQLWRELEEVKGRINAINDSHFGLGGAIPSLDLEHLKAKEQELLKELASNKELL